DRPAELALQPVVDGDRQQRVGAEVEEIVVGTDGRNGEDFPPEANEQALERGAHRGCPSQSPCGAAAPAGSTLDRLSAAASELTVGNWNSSASETSMPSCSRSRLCSRMIMSECPPRSKKLS